MGSAKMRKNNRLKALNKRQKRVDYRGQLVGVLAVCLAILIFQLRTISTVTEKKR
jgi:hypothetical protein